MKPNEATHIRIGKDALHDLRMIGNRNMSDNDVIKMLITEHKTNRGNHVQ